MIAGAVRERAGKIIRRRPFVPLAILFASGIATSRCWQFELRTGVILVCAAIAGLALERIRWPAIALVIFALGAALYSARYEIFSENDLRLIFEEKPALLSVRGRLIETPGV